MFESTFEKTNKYKIENCFSKPETNLIDFVEFRKSFFKDDPRLSEWKTKSSDFSNFASDIEEDVRNFITARLNPQ